MSLFGRFSHIACSWNPSRHKLTFLLLLLLVVTILSVENGRNTTTSPIGGKRGIDQRRGGVLSRESPQQQNGEVAIQDGSDGGSSEYDGAVLSRESGDWRACIITMGNHVDFGTSNWKRGNPCGFESRESLASMREVLFPPSIDDDDHHEGDVTRTTPPPVDGTGITAISIGDSLVLRSFTYDVNKYLPPNFARIFRKPKRMPIRWVLTGFSDAPPLPSSPSTNTTPPVSTNGEDSPPHKPSRSEIGDTKQQQQQLKRRKKSMIVFRKGFHVYDIIGPIGDEIRAACRRLPAAVGPPTTPSSPSSSSNITGTIPSPSLAPNVIFLSLGNWDMNWKVNKLGVPGLHTHYQNTSMDALREFFTGGVSALFASIQKGLDDCRGMGGGVPPLIILREQYMANCKSPRFTTRKTKFRECEQFVAPVLIPLYRRILAAAAWAHNIPVIPTEHIFAPGSGCILDDGLHLGAYPVCASLEHQQYWETYRLLRDRNVTQGLLPLNHYYRNHSNSTQGGTEERSTMNKEGLHPNTLDAASIAAKSVNVFDFYEFLDDVGVGTHYRRQAYPSAYGRPTKLP